MILPEPSIEVLHIDPVRAEVRFSFDCDHLRAGAVLQGRIVGPRCPGTTTIEISYPLRPVPGNRLALQAIIPEPSYWEPICPFVYETTVEAVESGECLARRSFSLGLRRPG